MGKSKTELVTQDTTDGALQAAASQFNLGVKLDTGDALAIFTSGAEKHIRKGIAAAAAKVKYEHEQLTKLENALTKLVDAATTNRGTDPVAGMVDALARFGYKVEADVTPPNNPSLGTKVMRASVVFRQRGLAADSICPISFEVKVTPAMRKLIKQIQERYKAIDAAKTEQLKWTRRLSTIPALEKEMRATLATAQAEKTVEGREMLALMSDNITGRLDDLLELYE